MSESHTKDSAITRGSRYVSESIDELKKIHAPTRAEAVQATLVTMVIVIFIAVVVSVMDLVFGWITRMAL